MPLYMVDERWVNVEQWAPTLTCRLATVATIQIEIVLRFDFRGRRRLRHLDLHFQSRSLDLRPQDRHSQCSKHVHEHWHSQEHVQCECDTIFFYFFFFFDFFDFIASWEMIFEKGKKNISITYHCSSRINKTNSKDARNVAKSNKKSARWSTGKSSVLYI